MATQGKVLKTSELPANGQVKVLNVKKVSEEEIDLNALQKQLAEMNQVLNSLQAQQIDKAEREAVHYDSNTNGRRKAVWFIVLLSLAFGVL